MQLGFMNRAFVLISVVSIASGCATTAGVMTEGERNREGAIAAARLDPTPDELRNQGNRLARQNDDLAKQLAAEVRDASKASRTANNLTTGVAGVTAVLAGVLKDPATKTVGIAGGLIGAIASWYSGQKQPGGEDLKCVNDYTAAKSDWLIARNSDATVAAAFAKFVNDMREINSRCPTFVVNVP